MALVSGKYLFNYKQMWASGMVTASMLGGGVRLVVRQSDRPTITQMTN